MYDVIMKAFGQTVYMVIGSTIFSVILGFIPAIVLTVTAPDGLRPNKIIYGILDILVNVFRSFPFIILMVIVVLVLAVSLALFGDVPEMLVPVVTVLFMLFTLPKINKLSSFEKDE